MQPSSVINTPLNVFIAAESFKWVFGALIRIIVPFTTVCFGWITNEFFSPSHLKIQDRFQELQNFTYFMLERETILVVGRIKVAVCTYKVDHL